MRHAKLETPLEVASALRAERQATVAKLEALRAKAADADATIFGRAKRLLEVDVAADARDELAHFERRLGELDGAIAELADAERQARAEAANAAWVAALPEICARRREVERAAEQLVAALERTDAALAAAHRSGATLAPIQASFGGRDVAAMAAALQRFQSETDVLLAATSHGEKTVSVRLLSDRENVGRVGQTVKVDARMALALQAMGVGEVDARELVRWRESANGGARGA